MSEILNDSANPNKDKAKILLTYLIDERESSALDTLFDELFGQVMKQIFPNTKPRPNTITTNKEMD